MGVRFSKMGETLMRCELGGADSLSLDAILLSFLSLSLLSLFRGEKD